MSERIPQSVAKRVLLKLYLSSDHTTEATGKTLAVTISKNGAAFANPSAGATNATEVASGWYYVDLSTTDTGTTGPLIARGTCSGCDNAEIDFEVASAHNAGFDGVPNATAGAANGLPLGDASGRVDVGKILGTASAGAAGYMGVDWGHVNAPTTTVGLTGTTISTSQAIASVSGAVGSVTGAVGSVAGNVGGTVATVTNLTNAPTSGDFTAAMKTSLNAATPVASLSGDLTSTMKASVTAAVPTAAANASAAAAQITTDHGSGSYASATPVNTDVTFNEENEITTEIDD